MARKQKPAPLHPLLDELPALTGILTVISADALNEMHTHTFRLTVRYDGMQPFYIASNISTDADLEFLGFSIPLPVLAGPTLGTIIDGAALAVSELLDQTIVMLSCSMAKVN